MKLFKWQFGRQESGYKIFPLIASKEIPFDCYLIEIPQGVEVPPHTDPVQGKEHYRANLHFGRYEGGDFFSESFVLTLFKRFFIIRPDIKVHSMNKVTKGKAFIFSVGWAKRKQPEFSII